MHHAVKNKRGIVKGPVEKPHMDYMSQLGKHLRAMWASMHTEGQKAPLYQAADELPPR